MLAMDLVLEMEAPEDVRELVDQSLLKEAISLALNTLTDREKKVLTYHFFDEMQLKQIGKEFNITGGRIGEIMAKGLRKLRRPVRSIKLIEFLEEYETLTDKEAEYQRERIEFTKDRMRDRLVEVEEERILNPSYLEKEQDRESGEQLRKKKLQDEWEAKYRHGYDLFHFITKTIHRVKDDENDKFLSRVYRGSCGCKPWESSYRLPYDRFEIGCYTCQTKFFMEAEAYGKQVKKDVGTR